MAFISNTSANTVFEDLVGELSQEQEINNELIGQISQDEAALEEYLVVVKSYDNNLVTKVNLINTKKQQIVNAFNAIITGTASSCTFSNTVGSSSTTITVSSTEESFDYSITGNDDPFSVGKRSEIRRDIFAAEQYPDVETYNLANANSYFDNISYTEITSGNLGLGEQSFFYYDGNDSQGLSAASTLLGYYYPITNVSGVCHTTKQNVNILISEINTLRTEIITFLSANSGGGFSGPNNLKRKKHKKKLNAYSTKISKNFSDETIARSQSAISSMTTNESIIKTYESTL